MLRFLVEEKYDEVISVLGSFPHIAMETKLQGPPWEDTHTRTHTQLLLISLGFKAPV